MLVTSCECVFAAAYGIVCCNTFQVTGHTATAGLGSQMVVLGGGNKRQFHSCRHVLVYDPIERTWSKLATRGNAPTALIYHRWTLHSPSLAKLFHLSLLEGGEFALGRVHYIDLSFCSCWLSRMLDSGSALDRVDVT